jgi:hypothetical protein
MSSSAAVVLPRLRARWMALGLLVATCATAAVAAHVGRGWLEDSWWIWKLGSEDRDVRIQAAWRLSLWKSIRAVPRIVAVIVDDPKEDVTIKVGDWEQEAATAMVYSLWQMGEPALPSLKRCLDGMAKNTRPAKILERLLDRSVPLKPAAFVLRYR